MTEGNLIEYKFNYIDSINDRVVEYQKTKDKGLLELIIKNNLGLVKSEINRFRNLGIDYEDLFQEASLKLYRAIETYDPNKGMSFGSYAVALIRYHLKKYIPKKRNIIHYSVKKLYEVFPILYKIEYKLGVLSDYDLSEISGFNLKTIEQYRQYQNNIVDIEQPVENLVEDSECFLYDTIIDEESEIDDKPLCQDSINKELMSLLSTLNQREINILMLRYFYEDEKPLPYRTIGEIYKISGERIRQIEYKSLRKIRHPFRSRKLKELITN